MAFLTSTQLHRRTSIEELKEENADVVNFFLDTANEILADIEYDTGRSGYTNALSLAAQKLTEHLWINNQRDMVEAANRPFRSERLGSYSYTKDFGAEKPKSMLDVLPPFVGFIVRRYMKNAAPKSIYTGIFREEERELTTGMRDYHDLLDAELALIEESDKTFTV